MKPDTLPLGNSGENSAIQFLKDEGCTILERNYRTRFGEIDIIAQDGDFIVFVEVKTRRSIRCGNPFEAVDIRKQRRISKVALDYITRRGLHDTPARFDVIAVTPQRGGLPRIEIIRNGFDYVGPAY